jgi:hypothetical protein
MEFRYFNSVLGLFAVFNFVYFGAKEFGFILNDKIYRSKRKIEDILSSGESIFTVLENNINQVAAKEEETENRIKEAFQKKLKKLKLDFKIKENEIKNEFEENNRLHGFPKICLFFALYCISILLITGLVEYLQKLEAIYSYLLFVNSCVLISVVGILVNDTFDKLKFEFIKSIHVIIIFSLFVIVGIAYYLLCLPHGGVSSNLKNLVIISSVLLPIMHFIAYSLRFFVVHHWLVKKATTAVDKTVKKVEAEKESIKTINETLTFVENLKKK